MGIIRDLYYARKISAGAKLPAPTVALLIKRLYLASRMGGGEPGHQVTVTGTLPMVITNAVAEAIHHLTRYGLCAYAPGIWNTAITQYGKCVQDGTPTPDAPVDIMTNNGAIKVSANLANMVSDNIVVGKYINNSGVETSDTANFYYAPYIPVTPGGTYTMATSSSIWYFSVMQYDSSKNFLRRTIWGATNTPVGTEKTFSVGSDCAYIRFGSNMKKATITESDVLDINWMLTQTATAQDFRPYGEIYAGGTHPGQNLVDLTAVTDDYYYDPSGVYTAVSNARLTDFIPVKAGQKYTVYVKAATSGTAANVRCNLFDTAKTWKSQSSFTVNSGAEAVSVITPAEDGYLRVSANYTGAGAKVDWSTLQIVRGEYTLATMPPYEPYEEIPYQPELLTVSGGNLFDASSYTEINAYVNANTGVLTAGSPGSMTQYCAVIPCKPHTQYNITGQGTSAWGAFTSDSIGTTATATTKGGILTTGANDRYLIGLVRANGDSIDYRNSLVVQETQTASVPMLLGVGDSKDEGELISGLLTHKVGIYVVTGDESGWGTSSTAGIYTLAVGFGKGLVAICTHFTKVSNTTSAANMGDGTFKGHSTNNIVYFKDTSSETLADLQAKARSAYASGNPWIIVYALETETTEQGTAYPQLCNKLYNTADVTANVSDISVTVTTGEQTEPNQYSPLDILCNNGKLVWDGSEVIAVGTPEQLTVRPGMHLRLTGADFEAGTINDETGADDDNNNDVRTSGYIDVVPGGSYAIYWKLDDRLDETGVDMWLYYYDAEENLIGVFEDESAQGPNRRGYSFTAAEDCVKLRVSGKMTDTAVTPSDVVYLGIDTISTAAASPAGKNLFCFETSVFGKQIQKSGAIADLKTNLISDYIEVEAGVRYVLSGYTGNVAENNIRIGLYGDDKSQIGNIRFLPNAYQTNVANSLFVGSFLVPEDGKYTRFTMPIACSDVMLERGATQTESDTRTEYEPYWDESWQTASVVDLLAVGDDHKDDQDLVNGAVHRRTAACRYDGTQAIGNEYMSTTGGKDVGAIIVYPVDLATESATPQPLTLWEGTNQIDSVANVGPLTAQIKYYAATAQEVLSALLGTTVGPSDISTQDAETMINVITGGDT